MALIARIRSGNKVRTVRLTKGANHLHLQPGEHVEILDPKTGRAPEQANATRAGDDLVVAVDETTSLTLDGFYAAASGEAPAMTLAGTGYSDVTPSTSLMTCQAAGAAEATAAGGASTGGLFGLPTWAVIGGGAALAAGGIAVAATSGGSKSTDQRGNTVPPATPTDVALAPADDSGELNNDRITNVSTGVTITGRADPGVTVQIVVNGAVIGTGTATATGTFSIDVSLPQGASTVFARATNTASTSANSAGLVIFVDTMAPTAPTALDLATASDTGLSSTDNVTSTTNGLVFTGTAEVGTRVELFAGTTSLGTTTVGATGAFSFTVNLPAGVNQITARSTDTAGNVSAASTALAVTIDTTAPAAATGVALAAASDTGASSSDGITSRTSGLTIQGTAEAGARVELFDGTTSLGTTTAGANGTFTLVVDLAAGTHAISARTTDAAGNVGAASAPVSITIDATAPASPTVGSISGGFINTAEAAASVSVALGGLEAGTVRDVTLNGTGTAGGAVSLPATLDANGNLVLTPAILANFADGNFTISVTQTDLAGNVSAAASGSAVIDRASPTLSITSSSGALEFGQTATLTFTFSEAPTGFDASDVSVTGGSLSGFAVTANPLVYTATLTPTTPGAVVVTVVTSTYTDAAGNAGAAGAAGAINYDPGTSGSAVDGYIANALVFRDVNNNGVWDHEAFTDSNNNGLWDTGEAFTDSNGDGLFTAERHTTTNAQGDFSNLGGTGKLVLTPLIAGNGTNLSKDISTGAAFTKMFSATDGSTVITPLTTLVAAVAGNNATAAQIAQAEATVKAALGISSGVDLKTFDPIAMATANGATAADQQAAVEIQKVAVQVANVLNVVSTAASAAATATGSIVSAAAAAGAAAASLATQITNLGASGTLNLSNTAVMSQVISDVGNSTLTGAAQSALATQASNVSTALATVNEAVSQVSATDNVNAALAQVVATQIVAQVDLAAAAANAVSTVDATLDASAYSGSALGGKVDSAAAQVQVIVPVAATPQALGAPDRPTVDDGTRITAAEAANGIQISVNYTNAAQIVAGDKLRVIYDGVATDVTLGSGDIPAAGQTITKTVTINALGADGAKSISALFVAADGTTGPVSLPLLVNLDTTVADLSVGVVSGGAVNAAEAASGVTLAIANVEIGSDVSVTLAGNSAVDGSPLTVSLGRIDNEFRLTSSALGLFQDGSLTVTAIQTDVAGNVSVNGTLTFSLDRSTPATLTLGDISGGFITASEATANVAVSVTNVEVGLTPAVTVSGMAAGGGSLTLNVTGSAVTAAQLAQFADGTLTFRATQTDAAGNSSAVAITTALLSRTAAAPPTIGDISGGVINRAEALSNVAFTLSDVASGNTPTVRLSGGGLTSPITLTDSAGTYTLTTSQLLSLADGTYQISAFQTDAGGQASATNVRTVVIDTNNPSAVNNLAMRAADDTGASSSDGITNKPVVTLTGTGEAGARVDIFDGSNTRLASGTVAANGSFAVQVALAEGASNLFAKIVDAAGNISVASNVVAVTVDVTGPVALTAGTATADNIVNAAERAAGITISFGAPAAGATITAQLAGTAAAGGALTLNLPASAINQATGVVTLDATTLARFAQGSVTLSATQTDVAGNKSVVATRSFTIDSVGPAAPGALTLLAADDTGVSSSDRITNRSSVTISGTAETGATVEILRGTTSLGTVVANNGTFALSGVALMEGANNLTARQTDVAGNSGTTSAITVTRDTAAPAAPASLSLLAADDTGILSSDRITSKASVTITGTAEVGAAVTILNGSTVLGTAVANAGGQFSVAGVVLVEGVNALTARQTDLAGNTGSTQAISITRDSTAPNAGALTISGPALADGVLDVSERFSRINLTGAENGATLSATATGTKNGAPVTFALTNDIISKTWGTDGVVSLDFGTSEFSRAVTVLADGRILVAGSLSNSVGGVDGKANLAMLNADGSLDASFGTGGKSSVDLLVGNVTEDIRKVVALADGGFLIVGQTFSGTGSAFVGKVTASGALDTGFASGGSLRFGTSASGLDAALNASQQADGKILIAARLTQATGNLNEIATIRLNADGSYDSSFGTNGIARSGFGGNSRSVFAAQVSDGKILNIGFGGNNLIVSKLNANGTADASFGTNGRLNISAPTGVNFVGQPVLDGQGHVLVAGYGYNLDPNGIATTSFVMRLNVPSGTLDTTFGTNGITVINAAAPNLDIQMFQVAVDPVTGKIIVGGASYDQVTGNYATLARLNTNGTLDTTFDGNGILLTKQLVQVLGLATTANGSIIATAGIDGANGGDAGVIRIEPGQTGGFRLSLDDQLSKFDPGTVTIAVTQTDAAGNSSTTTTSAVFNPLQGSAVGDGIRGTAGNDTINADGGDDVIAPGDGNDTVDGGAGRDTVIFNLPAALTDTVEAVDGQTPGTYIVRTVGANSQVLFNVTVQPNGTVIVQGVGAAAAAGTDTLTNVEVLTFSNPYNSVNLEFAFNPSQIPAGSVNGTFTINGSLGADVINIPTLAPNLATTASVIVNGGVGNDIVTGGVEVDTLNGEAGDDTLSGGDGNDILVGGVGNDTLDGGAGIDVARFFAPAGLAGFLRLVQGSGSDVFVERVDGTTVEQLFRISPTSQFSATVTGLNSAAGQGTDTVSTMENLGFGIGTNVLLVPSLNTYATAFNAGSTPSGTLNGGMSSDTLNVATYFPGATGAHSINVLAGAGNDTVIGHAGNNYIEGGAGNDTIDGGAGFDTIGYSLTAGSSETFRAVDGTGADSMVKFIERVDGVNVERIARVTKAADGTVTVVGINSGAFWGTDTIVNGETVRFGVPTGNTVVVPIAITISGFNGNGSSLSDTIDLGALFPSALATDTLNANGNVGNDIIIGRSGPGVDFANYFNGTGTGTFVWSVVDGTGADAGKLLLTRTNGIVTETLFRVTVSGVGAATVESLDSSIPLTGTDIVTNIEQLNFNGGGSSNTGVGVRLAVIAPAIVNGNANVQGSVLGDTINLNTLYPSNLNDNISINGDRGNDTIIGNAGGNFIEGGFGNDTIDGGAGYDTASFVLPAGVTGMLRVAQGTGGDAANWYLERVEGQTVEQLVRISKLPNGSIQTVGLNSLASHGTDTLTNVEAVSVNFSNFANPASLQVATTFNPIVNNSGFITGGAFADTIDVAAIYNGITAATSVTVNGGGGNDTILGHAGSNNINGDAGNDTIDGRGGSDTANWFVSQAGGNLAIETGGTPTQFIIKRTSDNQALFSVSLTGSGSATVTGLNSAAHLGTDTLNNIGALSFNIQGGNGVYINSGVTTGVDNQSGNAAIYASLHDDTISVADWQPNIAANSPVVTFGFGGNDIIVGRDGVDWLNGNEGNDTLTGGGGDDTLTGGSGTDVAVFSGERASYVIVRDANTGNIIVTDTRMGGDGVDTLNGDIEILRFTNVDVATSTIGALITGTGGGEFLNGTSGDDVINALGGNDNVYGEAGDDVLTGGAGNDFINGAGGLDIAVFSGNRDQYTITNLIGGAVQVVGPDGTDFVGNTTDVLRFDDQDVTLAGTPGSQFNPVNGSTAYIVTGSANDDYINGSQVADNLNGAAGDDTIFAGDGDDMVVGALGDDDINGWNGNDTLFGNSGSDRLHGGDGDDTLIGGNTTTGAQQPGDLADEIYGGNGNDVIRGGDGDDRLFGDDGNDNLRGDYGNDTIDGGNGRDFASYRFDHLSAGQTIDFRTFNQTNSFSWSDGLGFTDQVSNVEALGISGTQGNDTIWGSEFTASLGNSAANQLSGFGGDDTINGAADIDTLFGGDGNDTLNGGGGNDELRGEAGNDLLDGGAGAEDVAIFSGARADYAFSLDGMNRVVVTDLRGGSPDGVDTLVNVEKVAFADQAGGLFLTTIGTSGNDFIGGSGSADLLIGNDGNDYLQGGGGNDTLVGGAGRDTAAFGLPQGWMGTLSLVEETPGTIRVVLSNMGNSEDLFRVTFTPNGANATVEALNSAISLHGTDTLDGIEQIDFFVNTGDNSPPAIYAGINFTVNAPPASNNNAYVSGSVLGDTIDLDLLYGNPAGGSYGVNGGFGNDTLRGTSGNNGLQGGTGNDVLEGRDGDDYLQGEAGNDTLLGGLGSDIGGYILAAGTVGSLRVVDGANAGQMIVQRVDGNTVEDLFRVTLGGGFGQATVEGLGARAAEFGTDTVSNVEQLHFSVANTSSNQFAGINLALFAGALSGGFASVNGSEFADTFTVAGVYPGATASDQVSGSFGRGNDVVTGHDGVNLLNGGAGDDTLNGLGGNDNLGGDAGNDTLNGGLGDDYLQGGAGNDTIDGGVGGNDNAGYILAAGTTGTLSIVEGTGGDAGKLIIRRTDGMDVENLLQVTITGSGAATVEGIDARASEFGFDTVTNIENLSVGVQNGQFIGISLTSTNFVSGTAGNDILNVASFIPGLTSAMQVNANGNDGDDTVIGHDGVNNLQGGLGNDTLNGLGGNDILIGGNGNDTIDGGIGTDVAQYVLTAGTAGAMSMREGANPGTFIIANSVLGDMFSVTQTGTFAATVTGIGAGAAYGIDTVSNIEQLAFFISGGGANTFVAVNFAPQVPALQSGPTFVTGSVNNDSYNLETLYPTATVNNVINSNGNQGNDAIIGHNGVNTLTGGAGDDILYGLLGDDILIGGFNEGFGPQPGDGNDLLHGDSGNDRLRGGDGDDLLYGDTGDDNIRGDAGSDLLNGGANIDFASYFFTAATSGVIFDASAFQSNVDFIIADPLGGTDTLVGIELLGIGGSNFNDVIKGGEGAAPVGTGTIAGIDIGFGNQMSGNAGDDQLTGGASYDRLEGGTGNDTLDGRGGIDLAVYNFGGTNEVTGAPLASSGVVFSAAALTDATQSTQIDAGVLGLDMLINIEGVTVFGTNFNDTFTGSALTDRLSGGSGNDTLNGGDGVDYLYGGAADDTLSGDAGDDVLAGEAGHDTLTGGLGADTFVLENSAGANIMLADLITDFSTVADKLQLGGGLSFADLTIADSNGDTAISVTSSGAYLAVLSGVDYTTISSQQFVLASGS